MDQGAVRGGTAVGKVPADGGCGVVGRNQVVHPVVAGVGGEAWPGGVPDGVCEGGELRGEGEVCAGCGVGVAAMGC